jgi:exopolysaccharide biosynthesis protein
MTGYLKLIFLIYVLLYGNLCSAKYYNYQVENINNKVIHIVTIDPQKYKISLLKSNEGRGGRETLSLMAKRSHAIIAINGGFFEIGKGKDGLPSGTLIISGIQYAVKSRAQSLLVINSNNLSIIQANPYSLLHNRISMLSGIPMLLQKGKINKGLYKKKSDFYNKAHARSAIGIKHDGAIILAVIEHQYSQKINNVNSNTIKGLTIIELAELMQKLGCDTALNLDGGGSSSLWVNGKIVNRTFGDIDESNGEEIARPISDAIIFN